MYFEGFETVIAWTCKKCPGTLFNDLTRQAHLEYHNSLESTSECTSSSIQDFNPRIVSCTSVRPSLYRRPVPELIPLDSYSSPPASLVSLNIRASDLLSSPTSSSSSSSSDLQPFSSSPLLYDALSARSSLTSSTFMEEPRFHCVVCSKSFTRNFA